MRTILFLLTLLLLTPALSSASGVECSECLHRKRRLCDKECSLVIDDKQATCQSDCIREYCEHRCGEDHPGLPEDRTKTCSSCLNAQFVSCKAQCPTGTAREMAICQLTCGDKRCLSKCENTNPE